MYTTIHLMKMTQKQLMKTFKKMQKKLMKTFKKMKMKMNYKRMNKMMIPKTLKNLKKIVEI